MLKRADAVVAGEVVVGVVQGTSIGPMNGLQQSPHGIDFQMQRIWRVVVRVVAKLVQTLKENFCSWVVEEELAEAVKQR